MIQTNYVPLEHPYRVVYYNGVIGIQIGSLILAIEKQDEEGKRIVEIKTHPEVVPADCDPSRGRCKSAVVNPSAGKGAGTVAAGRWDSLRTLVLWGPEQAEWCAGVALSPTQREAFEALR